MGGGDGKMCFDCLETQIISDFLHKLSFNYATPESPFPFASSAVVQVFPSPPLTVCVHFLKCWYEVLYNLLEFNFGVDYRCQAPTGMLLHLSLNWCICRDAEAIAWPITCMIICHLIILIDCVFVVWFLSFCYELNFLIVVAKWAFSISFTVFGVLNFWSTPTYWGSEQLLLRKELVDMLGLGNLLLRKSRQDRWRIDYCVIVSEFVWMILLNLSFFNAWLY